ncbi:peptidoglycan-binding protein [Streptomyces yaizuensis]|uniref:Peptidoglycan-binding protein n=1 Tax=Streptomyces yaizuensis TaxID=2989713 RepID=A0ABQ5P7I4_9ACTN|nr:peptidoglycan-binding protein [Streptomyces sp. YSPA8]GLF98539.1 peptidoglycan-binding protein [Streptomyces sp. YSPA8]
MKLIKRAQWGAPPTSAAAPIARTRGVKVHYLGTAYASRSHDRCDDKVRDIRRAHLDHPTEDYSDIAYNLLVCEHGHVYEGRGAKRRTGANGTAALNSAHYAVCALLGNSGLVKPTPAMLDGIRDAIEYLREHGDAGTEIKGHRDGHATSCPGDELYAWVKRGAPRPDAPGKPEQPTKPPTKPTKPVKPVKPKPVAYEPFPGASFFAPGRRSSVITAMGRRLVAEGCGRYEVGPGPQWGEADRRSYAAWQRKLGHTGKAADGIPGKASWDRLKVPNT